MLDVFFVLLGCYFVIRGGVRGLVGEIMSLGGLLFSVYVGFRYSDTLSGLLGSATGLNRTVAQILAVIAVWLVMSILFSVLRRILKSIIGFASLGGVDRFMGIIVGLLKTVIVIYAVIIAGLLLAPVVEPVWMLHSDSLMFAGRRWPEVRRLLIDYGALPHGEELPDGTLEQILRPYRNRENVPGIMNAAEAWALPLTGNELRSGWAGKL